MASQGSLSTQTGSQVDGASSQVVRPRLAPRTFSTMLSTVPVDRSYNIDRFLGIEQESLDSFGFLLELQRRHSEDPFDRPVTAGPQAGDHDMELREVGSFQEDFVL